MPVDTMPATEARRLIARLGWTQAETAEQLGLSERHMRRCLAQDGLLKPAQAELLRRALDDRRVDLVFRRGV